MFKIATWNVNSLRVRLPHVLQWLAEAKPDVLALQETKIPDSDFPFAEINEAGYECVFNGQRTYNGVALLTRKTCMDHVVSFPEFEDPQRRVLGATHDDIRILNLYIPNGESLSSDKYLYKLKWLERLQSFLHTESKKHSKFIILGDFNIAPSAMDVHDPAYFEGQILCSDPERNAFNALLSMGFADCFRMHDQPEKSYSWWDYRMNSFKRNLGLRIDHILASSALASQCKRCYVDKSPRGWERPSDHAPVVAEFT